MGASARRTTGTAAARSPRAARAGTCGERGALAFGDLWRSAVKGAGLPDGTRFRDLRHFYASALIDANLKPKVIQARLGHATIAETMDTYGHLFPGSEDLGRGAVDDALAGALAEQEQERPVSAQALARARLRGEPACRPGSVRPRQARAGGHPSGTTVAGSLVRSTREHRAGTLNRSRRPRAPEGARPL